MKADKPMKQINLFSNAVILFSALTLGCLDTASGARALAKPPVPDFTQGGKKDDSHDWLLGPTGARGWMFFRHEDLTAASPRLIVPPSLHTFQKPAP
jgi:hypothetical protein